MWLAFSSRCTNKVASLPLLLSCSLVWAPQKPPSLEAMASHPRVLASHDLFDCWLWRHGWGWSRSPWSDAQSVRCPEVEKHAAILSVQASCMAAALCVSQLAVTQVKGLTPRSCSFLDALLGRMGTYPRSLCVHRTLTYTDLVLSVSLTLSRLTRFMVLVATVCQAQLGQTTK